MNGYEKLLVFGQIIAIVVIWVRFENRLSRLEGCFDMFVKHVELLLSAAEKRPGS